jgi:tyrosyl-tRNA synthetase
MGTDITAKSLHAGHLVLLLMLKRLKDDGHRVVILLGGATSLIGDPTGRNKQRPMLSTEDIQNNIDGIKKSVRAVLGDDIFFVNNADWLSELRWIDMLRQLGPKVSINKLIKTDTFAQRLNNNENLSFLEICYPLCQAFDFVHLNREYECTVQCGGSDQWSNILAGAGLQEGLHGMTCPLLTDSKGRKISKSTTQEAWINPEISTAFELWQFFRNLPDDVILNMHYVEFNRDAEINQQKAQVASYMTALVHGESATRKAEEQSAHIYAAGMTDALPERKVSAGVLHKVLRELGLAQSGSAARALVRQGAVKIDGVVVNDECMCIDKECAVMTGKKGYKVLVISA